MEQCCVGVNAGSVSRSNLLRYVGITHCMSQQQGDDLKDNMFGHCSDV